MIDLLIINKGGDIKEISIKETTLQNLYSKCGFKKIDGFEKAHTWKLKFNEDDIYIELFGKKEGRANYENKYDLPPPIDNILFFGSIALLAKYQNESKGYYKLKSSIWNQIYEKLFGGFEDLSSSAVVLNDEEEEDELDNISDKYKTKEGYLKDGFVVDGSDKSLDSESEEENIEDSENSSMVLSELVEEEYENE